MQRHGKVFARRAHGGAAPQVDNQPAWPVAMVLQMAAQQFLGQLDALRMGRAAGDRTRIDREEVASGGQHVLPPPRG